MRHFANLEEVEAALEPFHPSRLARQIYTTEHIREFMEYVGNPQDTPKSIHIAGTSGKTSTAYYSAALLKQAGKRVGLLVSPHAEKLNERVQIDLEPLDERVFCDEFAIFIETVQKSGLTLSRAELLYGFAYWEFARQRVEYIVVEVGMGGLLDATNVISRDDKISVITDIGMDHTNVLGDTIEQIAEHKAGIIRLHNHVFCYRQDASVMQVIEGTCRQRQADLHILEGAEKSIDLQFLPLFQRRNFTLALSVASFALERAGTKRLTEAQALEAAHTHIPSRMEIVEAGAKTLVLDGAHNAQKLRALADSVCDYFPGKDIALLVAFTGGRGRDVDELAKELAAVKPSHVIVTSIETKTGPNSQYVALEEVAAAFERVGVQAEVISSQPRAYQALLVRPEQVGLVTGSIYLLSDLKAQVMRTTSA